MNVLRRQATRRPTGGSGQALAEMALVIPALLLLVFGIIEFGTAWRDYQVITNAAREGARRAVMADAGLIDSSEPAVLQIIQNVMTAGGLDIDAATVAYSCEGVPGTLCDGLRGAAEEVRIDYRHEFLFLGPLAALACTNCADGQGFGTITLSTSSVMRSEG